MDLKNIPHKKTIEEIWFLYFDFVCRWAIIGLTDQWVHDKITQ